jgi:lysophospholipid acyltransferase (LPLAT)-like uncharacterized protein
MAPLRRILRSELLRRALCAVAASHIWLVHATGRWRVIGGEIPRRFWDEGKPFILCFWHGRLLMMPYCWRRSVPIHMLISRHRDGQIIARTVRHFGIDTIAGSSSRGGGAALRTMLRALKAGACIGITPDGPRGPRMRASRGIVDVARLAQVPIVPATFAASRRSLLESWDRFVLAWPFAGGVFVWGEPIVVPADADEAALEAARQQVEDRLNEITRRADLLCRKPAVEPAQASAAGAEAGGALPPASLESTSGAG